MKQPVVSRNRDVMGGTLVFHGTRVPVQALLDYLEARESIAFIKEAKDRVV